MYRRKAGFKATESLDSPGFDADILVLAAVSLLDYIQRFETIHWTPQDPRPAVRRGAREGKAQEDGCFIESENVWGCTYLTGQQDTH